MNIPNWLIITGGIGQLFTAVIYPFVRHRVFDWYNDIKKLKPLNQEIAKTYGYYIQGLNFAFGLIAIVFTDELKDQSNMALAITVLIAAYWIGKLITQFAYYPMYQIPKKLLYKVGEIGMNALFFTFGTIYTWLVLHNLQLLN